VTKKQQDIFAIFQYARLCLISFLLLHFITFLSFLLVSFIFAEFTSEYWYLHSSRLSVASRQWTYWRSEGSLLFCDSTLALVKIKL